MRRPMIAGNWKMNMTVDKAIRFIDKISKSAENTEDEVVICPPSIFLGTLHGRARKTAIRLGAQNIHQADSGAFTGEISADMLKEYEITHCLIGHSERRKYFNETDETVNLKLKKALEKKITPIVCVGETLEEREAGETEEVIKRQIREGFNSIPASDMIKTAVAYEPIWAIGTGRTAAPGDAQNTIAYIRGLFESAYGPEVSSRVRILYGGSVNPSNIQALMAEEDIDGVLVGGASLDSELFIQIIEYK